MRERRGVKYDLHRVFYVLLGYYARPRATTPRPRAFARAFGSSGYEYRISNCGRLKQPANLSVIFHSRPGLFFLPFFKMTICRTTVALARERDVTSRAERRPG